MRVIKRICFMIIDFWMILKIIILSALYKNKMYIFGTPIHGNIGDQAIIIAEREFMKDNFPKLKVIEVESKLVTKFSKILKNIIGNTTILIHGGGFLGTIWMNEEEMFRTTVKTFTENKIIVFPQTVYFSNDNQGKEILKESRTIYSSHKKLVICCREQYSYDFMKKEMPECNVILVPDMVIYLKAIRNIEDKQDVLFCIRNDREKVNYDLSIIESKIEKQYNIDYTDTVIPKKIFPYNRRKILDNKLEQFTKYKLIVTDRLHGMVFALLAQTPCIVLENKSYKVKGVYEWIKEAKYIKLCDIKKIDENIVNQLVSIENYEYNREKIIKEYKSLVETIRVE